MQPDHGASSLPGGWLPCGWPSEQGDLVGHVTSHYAECAVAIDSNDQTPGNLAPAALLPGLHPRDLRDAYGLQSHAAGMTVAIVDAYDDPKAESDLNVYRAKFGLSPCTTANGCFRKVNQKGKSGPYPAFSRAWAYEIALDLEMVSAVCPQCSILLVEAKSANIDDLGASVDTAVALGARVVSNSYYAVEWAGELSEDVHYNHPGVAIVVSSGDNAVAHYGDNAIRPGQTVPRTGPYYPAASPYVTAVGGTSLKKSASTWRETAWAYDGQGCSKYEARPAFQPHLCTTRSTVDMAAVGDPQTGVSVYATQAGGWVVAGGTSVAAPLVAAAYALSGNPTGPAFAYGHAGAFRDIRPARFDAATGLGSPNGTSGL